MNNERIISRTPTVHKLGEVSSWCLADCSKCVRESESVKKRECVCLSCWLGLPAARKRREIMCALSCWQVCPARRTCVEEGERMLPRLLIVARESDPSRMAWNILIGRKYEFGTKTVKIFLRQTIIWNSFCNRINKPSLNKINFKYRSHFLKCLLHFSSQFSSYLK